MNLPPIPEPVVEQFQTWLAEARQAMVPEYTAMNLATVKPDGRPANRMVLLKFFDEQGFVFFTNTESRKGHHLAHNPAVALTFFWMPLYRQVLVEGLAESVSPAEADAYWETRDRTSQIGAWASQQSRPLDGRETLLQRVARYEREFEGRPVPRPPYWSGYRVRPDRIEFWQGQDHRLHDRDCHFIEDGQWKTEKLYP